jgi:nucleoid-associated protein EbfC
MIPEGDMSGLLAQAQAMQQQLLTAQQELADTTVEGTPASWSAW